MAARAVACRLRVFSSQFSFARMMCSGEMGSGSGKGGGGGGTIREAGGAFGKMEQAHEEQYFRQLREQQLKALREQHKHMVEMLEKDISHHESQIKHNKEQIDKYKKMIDKEQSKKDGSDSD
ncbi:ATPase inhibitor, mitochondrial [Exaiptasia diaphana]|uniref:Mitochondrial ATPase inhibitor n=1 Tax=Exaiptasia diaphana TaxID=2652724 RepID=A0A913X3P9_EXADI|nr:ATPase inhibitor, mitochondrial [Exaiptasia diaphana]KXJ15572.1 ATPase inhibitor, mitochondrial [Exaiptasia diaphana]